MALCLRSDYFGSIGYGLWIGYTDAERIGRLMEHARWWLSRGNGKWARHAATAAREMRRKEFPRGRRAA